MSNPDDPPRFAGDPYRFALPVPPTPPPPAPKPSFDGILRIAPLPPTAAEKAMTAERRHRQAALIRGVAASTR
jgi:hypothetical protein